MHYEDYKEEILNQYRNCKECEGEIKSGETCFGEEYSPYKKLCLKCKTIDFMSDIRRVIRDEVHDMLFNHQRINVSDKIREIVREELKTIIREEISDPDGAFSPN